MNYKAPHFLFNAHLETIFPSLMRSVTGVPPYTRERISTPDDDFLDLDWLLQGSSKLIIISHGLEGSSDRAYVKGLAKAGLEEGYDILAWNFRGCGGEINRKLRFYHSGATDDLDTVVQYAIRARRYSDIYLMGFSLGGNVTLKYAGERTMDPLIKRIVTFSVPLSLKGSCAKISQPTNWIYANRFLKSLKSKIIRKSKLYPELDTTPLSRIKTLETFDDLYTAPIHGFANAADYYSKCSSVAFVNSITVPTLIINAKNDPFLSEDCFPQEQLHQHTHVTLEIPVRGGHVGFSQFGKTGRYWSEDRAMNFIRS